jgi:hypothetical protein
MALNLDNLPGQFVDVDFPSDPNFVFGDCGPRFEAPFRAPLFEDENELIPESQWEQIYNDANQPGLDLSYLITRIMDQGPEGSCVANAASQAHQITQARQFGKENVVQLSAISLYDRIGSSANSGAMVEDGLQEMTERGIVPLNNAENKARFSVTMPHTGFSRSMPSNWEEVAAGFAGTEFFEITSVKALVSALLKGFPCPVGRAGHSICYTLWTPKGIIYPNSWGDWGFGAGDFKSGFGMDTTRLIQSSASWCYALRSVRDWRTAA